MNRKVLSTKICDAKRQQKSRYSQSYAFLFVATASVLGMARPIMGLVTPSRRNVQSLSGRASVDKDMPIPFWKNDVWHATLEVGKTLAATATLTGVLLFSPDSFAPNSVPRPFLTPPPVHAESVLEKPQSPIKEEVSVLDEVWTLIGKYYIDRTFNGQVRSIHY